MLEHLSHAFPRYAFEVPPVSLRDEVDESAGSCVLGHGLGSSG